MFESPWNLPDKKLPLRMRVALGVIRTGDRFVLVVCELAGVAYAAFVSMRWWNLLLSPFVPGLPKITLVSSFMIRLTLIVLTTKTPYSAQMKEKSQKNKERTWGEKFGRCFNSVVIWSTIWLMAEFIHYIASYVVH